MEGRRWSDYFFDIFFLSNAAFISDEQRCILLFIFRAAAVINIWIGRWKLQEKKINKINIKKKCGLIKLLGWKWEFDKNRIKRLKKDIRIIAFYYGCGA
jgi:hypothetical protein